MKSAKKIKLVSGCFAVILSLACFFTGCKWSSFMAGPDDSALPDDIPSGEQGNTSTDTPTLQPSPILYYNRYTGLACDESISSCRPISVCIANFDGKTSKGLSFADILIETPYDANTTRIWALTTDWNALTNVENISSVKSHMFPMMNAFSSICAYAGNDGTATPPSISAIDQSTGEFGSNFKIGASGTVCSSGESLLGAAVKKNYIMTDTKAPLPYRLAEADTIYTPIGNHISSIHFAYSAANTVDFHYDSASGSYLKSQSGEAHIDAENGSQLAFSNVLILFYNVSYYHTASGTSFTLDTAAGGNGFCYTGGSMVPVSWSYDNVGSLVFKDANGETLTLNRGKTYIGMMKITDSSSVVAK